MNDNNKTEIALSKKKLIKGLIVSIIFVLMGILLLIVKPQTGNAIFDNAVVKYGVSISCILFFGFAVFYFAKKLTDRKPGLIIDDHGIIDNSSALRIGSVPWRDIKYIEKASVFNQEFLMIIVRNPEDYINRQSNAIRKTGMTYNNNHYGSPIAISSNALKCDLEELRSLLNNKLLDFRNKA